MRTYSVAMPEAIHAQAISHLVRQDGQEDLCFALWYPSVGHSRTSALIHKIVLPSANDRMLHGNASFSGRYFERALQAALDEKAGLALMHSHLSPGWQGMSRDDLAAELNHAGAVLGGTSLPLVGLTMGSDGAWSARFWIRKGRRQYERYECQSVRVVGRQLQVTYNDRLIPRPGFRTELTRTISAWGQRIQGTLARLHIGIIGVGSVGMIIAEALARMGIEHIRLMDFDSIETVNLDRMLHATIRNAKIPTAKVELASRELRKSATANRFRVEALEWSVAEEPGFRAALDCDVIFSCVDRSWPRSILNFIAYAHLIPVIDGGIRIETNRSGVGVKHADWRAHVAGPEHKCLECLKQYDPGLVAAEREGFADNPKYIHGLPDDHPFKNNQNVFAFSLATASFEVMQLLSMIASPANLAVPGAQMYHFIPGSLDADWSRCRSNCAYTGLISHGDRSGVMLTGADAKAVAAREARKRNGMVPSRRFLQWLSRSVSDR